jgi:predicted esterase
MRRASAVVVPALVVSLLAATLAVGPPVAASAAKKRKVDLKVTAGSASSTSPVRIAGSFTVKNTGKRKASATTAGLQVDGKQVAVLAVGRLKKGGSKVVRFSVPSQAGTRAVRVCADVRRGVAESKEGNNCRSLGTVVVKPVPSSTAPPNPLSYTAGTVFPVEAAGLDYSLHVPSTYASHHQTPMGLLVFLGGCGNSTGQTWGQVIKANVPDLASRDLIVMSPQRETVDGCWDTGESEQAKILGAIADVKTHFNIAPKKVIIGGYSSGSFLAGAVAFANVLQFAGVLGLNGPTFTGNSSQTAAIAADGWKVNVVMRAHTEDATVNIAAPRASRNALVEAGYPVQYSEVPGGHAYSAADFAYLFDNLSTSWSAP